MAAERRAELLTLIPAYAIGALDDDERAEVEAWLSVDAEAQALLAQYQTIADQLVVLAPLRPVPAHLQDDLRRRLASEAQRGAPTVTGIAGRVAPRRLHQRPRAWVLAAAALLTLVLLGALLVQLTAPDQPAAPASAAQLYEQIVAQAGASQYPVIAGEVDAAVGGTLVVSADGAQAVLRLTALPHLGADRTFQLWLIDSSGARTSAGLFRPDASSTILHIRVPFTQPISAYKGVGVSLEPAEGSPYADRPSGPRVLSVSLS